MKIDVISIFPEYLAPLQLSLLGKAQSSALVDIAVHDLRAQSTDNHNTVDDTHYGGGAGRSEEHTSELQSHDDIVCRLLREKKKEK